MQDSDAHSDKPALDYLFHPQSVAVAGVSADMSKINGGRMFTEILIKAGFRGKIYPVGAGGGEVFGLKIYPGMSDIPGSVDYVITSIPAEHTPQLLLDSATKGVKAVHMFTAGFSEAGSTVGEKLEAEITSIANQHGIRIVGPNCMGIFCPSSGLSFCVDFPRESGSVGYIAQSGGHSLYGTMQGSARGIRFSKVISYGNASNLDESDLLEYLTDDPETKIIAAYIEGVKNGQRFFEVLKRAASLKPVVIFKGGTTEYGARTASSHTAAIAGSAGVWSSLIKQAGAIQATSVDELFDMVALFYHMSPPTGRNVAVMGLGGGVSVMAADACAGAGLAMPQLSPEISRKLKETEVTDAGKIFNNPVDIFAHGSSELIQYMVTTILDSGQIDLMMIHIAFDTYPVHDAMESAEYIEALTGFTREIKQHTIVVLYAIALPRSKNMAAEVQATLAEAGFPVFPSFTQAASAYAKFSQYHGR